MRCKPFGDWIDRGGDVTKKSGEVLWRSTASTFNPSAKLAGEFVVGELLQCGRPSVTPIVEGFLQPLAPQRRFVLFQTRRLLCEPGRGVREGLHVLMKPEDECTDFRLISGCVNLNQRMDPLCIFRRRLEVSLQHAIQSRV